MTEAEWLASEDPKTMLDYVREKAGERKLRLFAAGCCIRVRSKTKWERTHQAILAAELYADGLMSAEEVAAARQAAHTQSERPAGKASATDFQLCAAAMGALFGFIQDFWGVRIAQEGSLKVSDDYPAEWKAQSGLLRDIFGNPFRSVTFLSEWHTSNVLALAQQMYESRDFSAMPILADALQDAGCYSADILDHCRGPGPHSRGCWALDLVLGKQ
ncbi:hypothetical protein [Fimbriiglobus ruber]|uniref:SMI1/KNR4 family protein n=1 Tax=Fimbriiglobus ruber TaxID=1908690 RepID=A0A225DGP5_9BACT|nr:hypothetical protein [Fimbriiglobus ruber]OWK36546.1 hypothetical protein FRUB_09109 [Fimbriiglobus ruber]